MTTKAEAVRVKCESVYPVDTYLVKGRRMGRCIKCGFEGALRPTRRLLYQHHREEHFEGAAEIATYVSAYMSQWIHGIEVHWCLECGAMVKDQDAHDDFHLSMVHDLNQMRVQLAQAVALRSRN